MILKNNSGFHSPLFANEISLTFDTILIWKFLGYRIYILVPRYQNFSKSCLTVTKAYLDKKIVEVWPPSVCLTIKPIWIIFQIWRVAQSCLFELISSLRAVKLVWKRFKSPHNGHKLTDSIPNWKSENTKTFLVRW